MDFTKLTKWSDRARDFHEFLGDVLEGERQIVSAPPPSFASLPQVFAVRDDVENALQALSRGPRRSGARGQVQAQLQSRFAAMAPFFEAGFLFESANDQPILNSMFLLGQVFAPRTRRENHVALKLPPAEFSGVLRGRITPLLRAFRLESLTHLRDASVFAFSVRRGVVVLLVCNRPHPWQVGVMERAHEIFSQADR